MIELINLMIHDVIDYLTNNYFFVFVRRLLAYFSQSFTAPSIIKSFLSFEGKFIFEAIVTKGNFKNMSIFFEIANRK